MIDILLKWILKWNIMACVMCVQDNGVYICIYDDDVCWRHGRWILVLVLWRNGSYSFSFLTSRWRPQSDKKETQKRSDNARFMLKNTTFKASLKTASFSYVFLNQKTLISFLRSILGN